MGIRIQLPKYHHWCSYMVCRTTTWCVKQTCSEYYTTCQDQHFQSLTGVLLNKDGSLYPIKEAISRCTQAFGLFLSVGDSRQDRGSYAIGT